MKVYVVVGAAGSYDDYHQWNVRAFTDKEVADIYAQLATDEATRIRLHNKEIYKQSSELFPYPKHFDLSIKEDFERHILINKQRDEWLKDNLIGPNKYDPEGPSNADYVAEELELDGELP